MTKELEQAMQELISIALTHCRAALDDGDLSAAEFFKQEAFELLEKLPENQQYIRVYQ